MNRDNLIFSPLGWFLFLFPVWLLWWTPKTMLNTSGESRQQCFVPDLREKAFKFSPLSMMLAVGVPYMPFVVLRYIPSTSNLWRVLMRKDVEFCQICLSCIYRYHYVLFVLYSVNVQYHIYWLLYIEPSTDPRHKFHLIMVNDPSEMLLNLVC